MPDASLENGGSWQEIASELTYNSYTVYGLEKNTEYNFCLVALPAKEDGRDLRYESDSIAISTLDKPYSFKVAESRTEGTSFYAEWENVDGAYYDICGLERGEQYSFKVTAACGNWNTSTDWSSLTVPGKSTANVEYRALLIGEVNFGDGQYAMRNYGDVEMIAKALETAKSPNESLYSVVRRKDLSSDQIIDAIRNTFSDADENDVSLFFIGTHGDTVDMGRDAGCIATVDSSGREGYLDLYVLADELSKVPGKVIVWLGSCGSGAGIYEQGEPQNGDSLTAAAMQAFSAYESSGDGQDEVEACTGEFRRSGKFYVLTASRYHEMSWGLESGKYNYFIRFLTEGISAADGMPADANADGKVTQHELFLYIKAREEDKEDFICQNVQEYPLNEQRLRAVCAVNPQRMKNSGSLQRVFFAIPSKLPSAMSLPWKSGRSWQTSPLPARPSASTRRSSASSSYSKNG